MVTWMVLAVVFSAGMAMFLIAPYFDPALSVDRNGLEVGRSRVLQDSKERALRAIKDLELDRSMGKVSDEDFLRAKDQLLREVATILEETRARA